MGHHVVERFVGIVGQRQPHDLHLVELVQTVQAAHVLAVGAGFAAETGGVGGHLDGEILLVEDHVAEDVRHRHLGRRDEVEIVHRGVVHLSLLVGQLSRAESRRLVDHHGRFNLLVARAGVVVEEVVDQRTLQAGSLALVNGKSRSGEFYAQVEIDDVVFLGQLPVRQRLGRQRRVVLHEFHHQIVLGRGSFGNDLGGEVGQQYDLGLQGVGRLLHLGRQFYRFFFERRHFGLFRFGFVAFALPHQRADHLGRLVLLRQTVIQLLLDRLAAVVELLDPVDDGTCVHALFGQAADGRLLVVPELFECKHR